MMKKLRGFYPEIEPYNTGMLDVGDGHRLYFDESGNKNGIPVVYLHGGPGGRSKAKYRRYFNPKKYRIILYDQRGCGHSTPLVSMKNNTTPHLVEDLEKLRKHLKVDKWVVFGHSWGSTLGLAYIATHARHVLGTVMHGIFLSRPSEAHAFVGEGGLAAQFYPEAYAAFQSVLTPAERKNPLKSYGDIIADPKNRRHRKAVRAWCKWEWTLYLMGAVSDARMEKELDQVEKQGILHTTALFETSFIKRNCYIDADALLARLKTLKKVPALFFQGRADLICPPQTAWDVHKAWPGSQLTFIENEGHANDSPKMLDALVRATDALALRIKRKHA